MIKKFMISVFVLAIVFGGIYFTRVIPGLASAQTGTTNQEEMEDPFRYVENIAFGIGERFDFDIGYGFINAGYATMEVRELIEYDGRPCYQIVSTANSNKFFSSFYRVEDRAESIVDAIGIFSWYFEKNLKEGNYRANRSYTIDQKNHYAVYKEDTLEVAPFVQDALSVLYYVRTQDLDVGKSIFIDNFTDGKNYPLEVKVRQKETVKVKAGTFDCIVVEPIMMASGVFRHEGRLKVWLTDDRLKMPVLMKSKVLVGSISAELTDYQLGEIVEF
ncbi:MAG: DUF3108 domain-containing protein [Candidatus Zixiibacteriota bacterium]|nr:MAG: DUF3108 domain-containing protein [candidate division Zixibacteria bacterium]HDL02562.1 DUF3108 domain-containing protein [candidate division Zixibacteria bacterium]